MDNYKNEVRKMYKSYVFGNPELNPDDYSYPYIRGLVARFTKAEKEFEECADLIAKLYNAEFPNDK